MVMQKNAINNIDRIFNRSTSQPRLKILPLSPLLPQTQNENFQDYNIPSIPLAAPKVEPVLQPLMVKLIDPAPTPPPRLQPSTSSILDPDPNPWIKILQNI